MWGLRRELRPVLADGQQTLATARREMRTVVELAAIATGLLIVAVGLLAVLVWRE